MVDAVRTALDAFFASDRARLLHLVVPPHAYAQTLAWIRTVGEVGARPRPVRVLAAPSFGPSRGWPARVRALAEESAVRAGFLSDPPSLDVLVAFSRAVGRELDAIRQLARGGDDEGPDAGLVIALAPQHIADGAEYARDVESLLGRPELERVRWIVVDAARSSLGDLVERIGLGAARAIVVESDARDRARIESVMAELRARGGKLPASLERTIPPGSPLRGPSAEHLRRRLELAEATPSPSDAARLWAEAAEALGAEGLADEAVHVAMQRARALIAAGEADLGQAAFVSALREAEERDMIGIVPEAYGSLGSLQISRGRFLDGLEAYARAGASAERRGDKLFAADMHRCAGHAALNANRPQDAKSAWSHAFELLGSLAPVTMTLDEPRQLVVLGLALADVFEEKGNLAAARGLRGHASAIEQNSPRSPASWD